VATALPAELPHDAGYLVLDEVELRALFGLARGADQLRYACVRNGRLSIAEVSARALRGCSSVRVNKALKKVQQRALKQIKSLRRPGARAKLKLSAHQLGRLHAFYALLYTNATLACSDP
jgi:hypothetical protein